MKTPYIHTPPRNSDNAFLRRERDAQRRRELILVVLALLPLGLGLLLYTWVQLETLAVGYRITDLDRRLRELQREAQGLELTAAEAARPSAIEQRAASELGMVLQTQEQTLYREELP